MTSLSPLRGRGLALLRCPICSLELTAAGGSLKCPNRHGFDIARTGYVNLLGDRRRLPGAGGDSAVQLRHRAAFLDAGHLDCIAATIARQARQLGAGANKCGRVLDAGCGTGHHLGKVVATLKAPVVGLGLDISSEAGRHAARRWPNLAFATADVWRPWPVRDAAADLVMSVFAPKNFAETARVLRAGGLLAMAFPGPNHLAELRGRFGLMRQHEAKADRYLDAAAKHIGSPMAARLVRRAMLGLAGVRDVILMGPNAHGVARTALEIDAQSLRVTFDVVVLFARKRN
jgi:23S rRNA (guanine745-N1)-methyltransferase